MEIKWIRTKHKIGKAPRGFMTQIVESIPDLKFWSLESLQHLYLNALDVIIEIAEEELENATGSEKGKITRYLNTIKNRRKRELPQDQLKMLTLIYNMVLAEEGMSPLPGFSLSDKWGDVILGNPEYKSVSSVLGILSHRDNSKKEEKMLLNVKRSLLVRAAKELNEVLGLEPPIDVSQKPEVLVSLLTEASGLLEEGDEITKETQDVLDYLNSIKKAQATTNEKKSDETKVSKEKVNEVEKRKIPKTPKTIKKEKTVFGSGIGTSAASIDIAILELQKATLSEIVEKAGCKKERARSHICTLVKKGYLVQEQTESEVYYVVAKNRKGEEDVTN